MMAGAGLARAESEAQQALDERIERERIQMEKTDALGAWIRGVITSLIIPFKPALTIFDAL